MRMNLSPLYLPEEDRAESASGPKSINLANHAVLEGFSEDRLQKLIFECPQLLPISALEPNFTEIIPVCRELPTPAGPLDNLFVTPQGNLILVECKLWRNPEARRKVIAQILVEPFDLLLHVLHRQPDRVVEIVGDEQQALALVDAAEHVFSLLDPTLF